MFMREDSMNTSSSFTDDNSRFEYVYLMHKKSNALDKFIELKVGLENQFKTLQSNWGSEYMSTQFDSFLKEHKIISQLGAPKTP